MKSSNSEIKPLNLGDLDPGFASNGILRPDPTRRGQAASVAWDAQRRYLIFACNMPAPRLYRASPNGELDPTFGEGTGYLPVAFVPGQEESVERVQLQPDGKIVLIGLSHDQSLSTTLPALARFEADGQPDKGFGSGGVVLPDIIPGNATPTGPIHGALQADGKILITYRYSIFDGSGSKLHVGVLARLNTNGSLDGTFGQDGMVVFRDQYDYELGAVLQQSDGRIVVGTIHYARPNRVTLVRLTPSGEIDRSFGNNGHAPLASQEVPGQIIQEPSGRLICIGNQSVQTRPSAILLRLHVDGSPDNTFKNTYQEGAHWRDMAMLPDGRILAVGERQAGTGLFASLEADGTLDELLVGMSGAYLSLAPQASYPRAIIAGDLSDTPALFAINPGSRLPEYTDFVDFNWNGWEKGPAAAHKDDLTIENSNGLWYLWNYTHTNNSAGVILHKTFALEPGQHYEFAIEVQRYNDHGAVPILSTSANGAIVGKELAVTNRGDWVSLKGNFMADVRAVVLAVVSHVASGHGNDYMIKDLMVRKIS